MSSETIQAIDCWVNPFTPEVASAHQPEFLVRVTTDYFHRADEVFRGTPLDQMVAMMDAAGIGGGVLTIDAANPAPMAQAAVQYPGRFLLSAVVDPMQGMQTLRTIDVLVKDYDIRLVRMIPFFGKPAPERQGVLPRLREVHRARHSGLGDDRHSWTTHACRAAAAALSR